ncbi:phosphatidylethanolamine N-methyltransferase-like [Acanthaster planci]|uniref:Phosphatidylethanolamine N-methyltransferase n=1 Tax=Acanthaster planci TaxID=133434 RepID=A0A8B7ZJ94_ACAPL|nr:phosphatidylethanolamine N-methyltransferase-like [Acanthaster planci]XP_022103358.1 phosphatidylethanolamine N-methyltransferase-like [Acanthaster planci]XP_022103359.1 phosphatidylethanolamine N-methyltransferase-like [Acanthaster planci]XP_022103360.1 phosphatidylethanolamine N-methyltransferase-like [Acanthaster planci]XP_022103361.1 phosphatidylethanolamine N-methyltransferase-like [Acanthaster planci]
MVHGCCESFSLLDFSKMELPAFLLVCGGPQVDWSDRNLALAATNIMFNPLFWNIMARFEFKTKTISKLCGGPRMGCVFLGATIFFLSAVRGRRYQLVLYHQPVWTAFQTPLVHYVGVAITALGLIFTLSSFFTLGFYGTFLGDYFGIVMEHRVTGFPFNLMENPMYWGTTMEYLGYALWYGPSPAGLLLTVLLAICYKIAIVIEGPHTDEVYPEHDKIEDKKHQ